MKFKYNNTPANPRKDSLDSTKDSNQIIEEEIKDESIHTVVKDQMICLLHLDNLSGLRGLMKCESLDYNALERYICCDITPDETVSVDDSNEGELGGV